MPAQRSAGVSIRDAARTIRRFFRLSPMQHVIRQLRRRDISLTGRQALEAFGGTGAFHTLDYARHVAAIDAWEIAPDRAAAFARNVPQAKISIIDTYLAAKNESKRYGLIVIDNPVAIHGGHVEHFDLFADLLALAAPDTVVIVNVVPRVDERAIRRFADLGLPRHQAARAQWYQTDNPNLLAAEVLLAPYQRHAAHGGFQLAASFSVRRHVVHYLVLHLLAVGPNAPSQARQGGIDPQ